MTTTRTVHPIILFPTQADYVDLTVPLERVLRNCELWWEGVAGAYLYHASIKVFWGDGINRGQTNPWAEVYRYILTKGYPADHYFLAFLDGWNDPQWAGWGNTPCAMVGSWAIKALESLGTPDAVYDDDEAANLIIHETGHALGLSHDFDDHCNFMGYEFCGLNATITEEQRSYLGAPSIIGVPGMQGCAYPRS